MESIGILGLSVREHDAATLGRFTLARAERPARLPQLAASLGVAELVYLATCNRVELLYRRESSQSHAGLPQRAFQALSGRRAEPGEADRLFQVWPGDAAVEHLFLVASGLDSAQLGEREIRGQLRDALTVARQAGTVSALLDALVEEALRVARQVHLRKPLGGSRESLADVALELLRERVQRTPSPVALVGVTPVTRRCAELLRRDALPFVVVNRTPARAKAMVAELGAGQSLSLEQFRRRPPRVEAILTATGAPGPVLERAALERLAARTASQEPPLIVDLSIPPDVDPGVAAAVEVVRIGMDEISGAAVARQARRQQDAAAARALVAEALGDLRRRLAERALAPVIREINARFRATALEGVERLLRHRGLGEALGHDAAAREALERWAETLARRFAHLPTLGLRGLAAEHGMLAVRTFLDAGDLDLLAAFGEIAEELEGMAPVQPVHREPSRQERRRRRGS